MNASIEKTLNQVRLLLAASKRTLESPEKPTTALYFPQPPFDVETNKIIPPEQIPTDCQGRKLIRYCKKGVHLFSKYHALWDRFYTLYNQKVYPVMRVDGW